MGMDELKVNKLTDDELLEVTGGTEIICEPGAVAKTIIAKCPTCNSKQECIVYSGTRVACKKCKTQFSV